MNGLGRTASDQSVGNSPTSDQTVGGFFLQAMEVARSFWPSKTAEHVAAIFGCSQRAAERHLAGDRTASADKMGELIVSQIGAALIIKFAGRMSPQQRATFWKDMAKAARRSELLEERARLERELASVGG